MKKLKLLTKDDIETMIRKNMPKFDQGIFDKIKFVVICIIGVILCGIIFIPNSGLITDVDYYYMQGIGGEGYGDGVQQYTYSQEFIPRDGIIDIIQIDIDKNGIESGGFLNWNVADRRGNVIAGGSIPYEEVNDHSYTNLVLGKKVKFWHRYYINVSFDEVNGVYPKIIVNRGEEQIQEGRRLFCDGKQLKGRSFVWAIEYGECVPLRLKIRTLLFSAAAVIAFLLKDKWKLWIKTVVMAISFFVMTGMAVYYGECVIDGPKNWWGEATLFSNCTIIYLVLGGVLLLSQSAKWTIRLGSIAVGVLYIADFFVLRFRGSTMKIWDIMSIRTAGDVAGNYSYKINGDVLVLISFLLFVWCISYSFPTLKCRWKYRLLISAVGVLYCILVYQYMIQDRFWDRLEDVYCETAIGAEARYRNSGYMASILFQIKESRIEKPEGYRRKDVINCLQDFSEGQEIKGKNPHIIVIVNESLADLTVLGDIPSEEPLTYMKSLEKNTVKGYVNVSVLGGGTSNTEFEFLTGNSMAYLPQGFYPFNMMNKRQESVVWNLQDIGYETYAMHPAPAANWNRRTVYPLLGFQNCYWGENFNGTETIHMGVSDRETYQKIIDIYENRKADEMQFIYDMTIQNHGGYNKIDVDNVIENTYPTVSEYLSLMRCSDDALEELIGYFENQPEDVVICIFGDHQPVFEDGFYEDIFSKNNKGELENYLNQYKTPFWIWANYDIEEQENIEISLNYLGGLLFETAGLPQTPYMQYVSSIRKEYPVLTANGCIDKDGRVYTLEELPDKLKEYERVQYYNIYDRD